MKKILETKDKNRTYILTEFLKYSRNVRKLTLKLKTKLYDAWNGYDYYDNKYILENINLDSGDKNYPTIDHKKSVFYCFNNNMC